MQGKATRYEKLQLGSCTSHFSLHCCCCCCTELQWPAAAAAAVGALGGRRYGWDAASPFFYALAPYLPEMSPTRCIHQIHENNHIYPSNLPNKIHQIHKNRLIYPTPPRQESPNSQESPYLPNTSIKSLLQHIFLGSRQESPATCDKIPQSGN